MLGTVELTRTPGAVDGSCGCAGQWQLPTRVVVPRWFLAAHGLSIDRYFDVDTSSIAAGRLDAQRRPDFDSASRDVSQPVTGKLSARIEPHAVVVDAQPQHVPR